MAAALGWVSFVLAIFAFIALDLGLRYRKPRSLNMKEALFWSLFWITVSVCFGLFLTWTRGSSAGIQFFTGYALEKLLSFDMVFIFVLVFALFNIPKEFHHRVLYLGMIGALLTRMGFVFAGVALVQRFSWLLTLFALFVLVVAALLFTQERRNVDLKRSWLIKWIRRLLPVARRTHGGAWVAKESGRWVGTTLLLAVITIEFFDLFYALESIPVIYAVTKDPFVIYTSNIFALLGLKSLYFVMANYAYRFHFMRYGLSLVLAFVGIKILVDPFLNIPEWTLLLVVFFAFGGCALLSFLFPKKDVLS